MFRSDGHGILGGLLVTACPIVLFATAGLPGGAVATVAVGGWLLAPVYGFAAGQVGLLLVATLDTPLFRLAGMEGALFLLLIAGLIRQRDFVGIPVFLLAAMVFAGGTVIGVYSGIPTWQLATAFLAAIAVSAYALYRYELVAMGLVEAVIK